MWNPIRSVLGLKTNCIWCLKERYREKKREGWHGAVVSTVTSCREASGFGSGSCTGVCMLFLCLGFSRHSGFLTQSVNRHIRLTEDSDLFIVWVCASSVCVSHDRLVTWSGRIPAFPPVTASIDSNTPWPSLWIRSSKQRMSKVRSSIQAYLLIYDLHIYIVLLFFFVRFILKCKQYHIKSINIASISSTGY